MRVKTQSTLRRLSLFMFAPNGPYGIPQPYGIPRPILQDCKCSVPYHSVMPGLQKVRAPCVHLMHVPTAHMEAKGLPSFRVRKGRATCKLCTAAPKRGSSLPENSHGSDNPGCSRRHRADRGAQSVGRMAPPVWLKPICTPHSEAARCRDVNACVPPCRAQSGYTV